MAETSAKVAVVGGGVTGTALATALLAAARARGRNLELALFDGQDGLPGGPVVLTPECRSRMAALGARVPPEWRSFTLEGIEVISAEHTATLRAPAGGFWVVDAWPSGEEGRQSIASALGEIAKNAGARRVERRVDRIERSGPGDRNRDLVVRANGSGERFDVVALAVGASAGGMNLTSELRPPPTVGAVQARLKMASLAFIDPFARLLLSPVEGVDGLFLIPTRGSIFAFAWGPDLEPTDFCVALMAAIRDQRLPEGFELTELRRTRVACGVSKRMVGRGLLSVGGCALGHPLQLGISDALACATRAAQTLLDASKDELLLRRRYVREALWDLGEDTRTLVKAVRWLRRAGPKAATAFSRSSKRSPRIAPFSLGVLGLTSPSPLALLASARWAGLVRALGRTVSWIREPLPPSIPMFEPDLYYVVDDDPDARGALTELLESEGAEVVCFADELALSYAVAKRPPTAVLLDVVLTWVDGLKLCAGLKRHPLTQSTDVVVMSGLDRPHIRRRALDAGASGFLAKPIDPPALFRALRRPFAADGALPLRDDDALESEPAPHPGRVDRSR